MNRKPCPNINLLFLLAVGQLVLLAGCDTTADFDASLLPTIMVTGQTVTSQPATEEESTSRPVEEASPTECTLQPGPTESTLKKTPTILSTITPLPAASQTTIPASFTPDITLTQPPSSQTPEESPTVSVTILSFEANVEPFSRRAPGDQVTLAWETEGGEMVTICARDHNLWEIECRAELPQSGTATFVMPQTFWVEYQLQVGGLSSEQWPVLLVHVTCPQDWFFTDPATPFACPSQTASYLNAVAQTFQEGVMIINQFGDITILASNQSLYRSIWGKSGGIGDTSSIVPPDGLYLPDPALAAAWLGEYQGTEDLKDQLGWATGPATSYMVVGQCEVNPPGPTLQPCYILGPDNTIYQLTYDKIYMETGASGYKEGTWQAYQPDQPDS
ncbi:MAG: hypothetical protein JXB07_06190 [Anaerolineae bacterium]|nr:hypothetical protein [Anaerolineae bacterium]